MRPNTEADFWSKIETGGPDECWLWTRSCNKENQGYGQFRFKGAYWASHRLAWTLANGPIPEGMLVCHTCDTPRCCNPAHLFLGTHQDNSLDMIRKGRHAKIKRKKPACINGHAFTPENTGRREKGKKRYCKVCQAASMVRWKTRNPETYQAIRAALNEARRTGRPRGRPFGSADTVARKTRSDRGKRRGARA